MGLLILCIYTNVSDYFTTLNDQTDEVLHSVLIAYIDIPEIFICQIVLRLNINGMLSNFCVNLMFIHLTAP